MNLKKKTQKNTNSFISFVLIGSLVCAFTVTQFTACEQKTQDEPITTEPTVTRAPAIDIDALADTDIIPTTDYSDYVSHGDISVITVDKAAFERAYDDYVNEVLESLRGTVYIDAPDGARIASGDIVSFYYTATPADNELASDEDLLAKLTNTDGDVCTITVGQNPIVPEYVSESEPQKNRASFADQLIGASLGETLSITVTIPDDFPMFPSLEGQSLHFVVTIVSHKIQNDPTALTDELVSVITAGAFTDIAGYKSNVLTMLASDSTYRRQLAYDSAYGKITVDSIPTDEYDKYIEDYIYAMIASGVEDSSDVRRAAQSSAEETLTDRIIDSYLADYYGVQLTKGDYTSMLSEYFSANQVDMTRLGITNAQNMEDYFGQDYFIRTFRHEKLMDIIESDAVYNYTN